MSIRKKRCLCANISVAGFALAYFACNAMERGFIPDAVCVWLMVVGVLACILFGYKSGYLKWR